MSKQTCDVLVRLPHGVIIGHDAVSIAMDGKRAPDPERLFLDHGVNEDVPRDVVERWIARNKNLAAVKRGDIRILDHDVNAVDSSNRK